jgi:LmbE family N-acetylglucosaminyl deacetylase
MPSPEGFVLLRIKEVGDTLCPMTFSLKSAAFRAILPLFAGIARDVTADLASGPVVIIAPHQDDDILSCGASILQVRRAAQKTSVIFVSDGSASSESTVLAPKELSAIRYKEAVRALQQLGIEGADVHFLNIPDNFTNQHIDQIADLLAEKFDVLQPRIVLSPYQDDPHPDHVAVARAVRRLVAHGRLRATVLEYPRFRPSSAIRHLMSSSLRSRFCRVDAKPMLDAKRKALTCHRSQMENLTGESTWQVLPPDWTEMFFQNYELFIALPNTSAWSVAPGNEARLALGKEPIC